VLLYKIVRGGQLYQACLSTGGSVLESIPIRTQEGGGSTVLGGGEGERRDQNSFTRMSWGGFSEFLLDNLSKNTLKGGKKGDMSKD